MLVALVTAVLGPVPPIETSGSCPSAEEVSATIAPLVASLPAQRLAEGAARVADLGDRFEVAAAGQKSQYVDAARDCAERARVAAVFIALALNPPAAILYNTRMLRWFETFPAEGAYAVRHYVPLTRDL